MMTKKATTAELKARALLARMSTERLVEQFELTETVNDPNIPTVRGWIMDELRSRDKAAFDAWTDSDDIFLDDPIESGPRKWFIPTVTISRRPDGRGWIACWTCNGIGYSDSFSSLNEAEEYFEKWPAKELRIVK